MIDTGTVRLVIFFAMFLVFAGDYNTVISTIFGKEIDKNNNSTELLNKNLNSTIIKKNLTTFNPVEDNGMLKFN